MGNSTGQIYIWFLQNQYVKKKKNTNDRNERRLERQEIYKSVAIYALSKTHKMKKHKRLQKKRGRE